MDTLDRFLVKEFGFFFVIILAIMASLYIGVDFFTKFWEMRLPTDIALQIYLYKIPKALELFVPVASLMACLMVLTAMSRQNEILALYSGGIGLIRISSQFIAMVAVICSVCFLVFDTLTPLCSKKEILLRRGIDPDTADHVLTVQQGRFWYRSGNVIYRVGSFDPVKERLEDVNVYLLGSNAKILERIRANYALYQSGDWTLHNGFVVTYPVVEQFPLSAAFETKRGVIPEKPADFKTLQLLEETMELKDLRKYIARNKSYGLDTTRQQVNYHERLAMVFTPLILVLIGIPFGTKPLKTYSMAKSVGFCFVLVFIYLVAFRVSLSLGKSGHIPAIVSGWMTNFIFLVYGLFAIFRRKFS